MFDPTPENPIAGNESDEKTRSLGASGGAAGAPPHGSQTDPGAGAASDRARPSRVGPYRLLRLLGEGGMGTVYLAEQEQPIRRTVALKLVKLGMDTREVIARFEAERQALALMNHTHIAKVYDAGATEQGRPYFVMEYVEGIPITEYCDRERLSIAKRIELFVLVCHAIHHAHQRGIIHRDVKPSNVLVADHDGDPLPKVIDFGVAKATTQQSTDPTLFTAVGQWIGTPGYMSPEQAAATPGEIGTTTDVYSLGVLLYQLLTGVLPLGDRITRQASWETIARTIREEEPSKPSTRAGSLGELADDIATRRRSSPSALRRQLGGDLDWIVMRALEKEPARRYQSVSELAADLERHLHNQPVLAGPPSVTYRLRKFAQRHRTSLAVSGVVLLSLAFALVESNRQRVRAERARDESEAVTSFLSDMLGAVDPAKMGRDVSVRQVLDQAAERIGERFPKEPLVQARLMLTMGDVYRKLGLYDQARPLLEQALALREAALGAEHLEVAMALNSIGALFLAHGDVAEAKAAYQRSLAIRERAFGPEHPEVARSLNNLGLVAQQEGDLSQARSLLERALAMREKTLGSDHPDVANTLINLAITYARQKDPDYLKMRPLLERAVAIKEKALGPDHPDLAAPLTNLASVLLHLDDVEGSRRLNERALAISEKAYGPDHPTVAQSLTNLANVLSKLGEAEEARRLYERALSIREKALRPGHPDIASSLINLAGANYDLEDYASAGALYARAVTALKAALGPDDANTMRALQGLSQTLHALGNETEALKVEARMDSLEHAQADGNSGAPPR